MKEKVFLQKTKSKSEGQLLIGKVPQGNTPLNPKEVSTKQIEETKTTN